jgi:hypothetical protein
LVLEHHKLHLTVNVEAIVFFQQLLLQAADQQTGLTFSLLVQEDLAVAADMVQVLLDQARVSALETLQQHPLHKEPTEVLVQMKLAAVVEVAVLLAVEAILTAVPTQVEMVEMELQTHLVDHLLLMQVVEVALAEQAEQVEQVEVDQKVEIQEALTLAVAVEQVAVEHLIKVLQEQQAAQVL